MQRSGGGENWDWYVKAKRLFLKEKEKRKKRTKCRSVMPAQLAKDWPHKIKNLYTIPRILYKTSGIEETLCNFSAEIAETSRSLGLAD